MRHQMDAVLFSIMTFAALVPGPIGMAAQTERQKPSGSASSLSNGAAEVLLPPSCRYFKGNRICRVGIGGVSPPKLISPVQQDYPPTLRVNTPHIPWTALVWAIVGHDGRTHYPTIVNHTDSAELERIAIEEVKKWRFSPAQRNGKPVAVELDLEIKFR
jgi:Gram-negative bacterial TonB protein C-terminal